MEDILYLCKGELVLSNLVLVLCMICFVEVLDLLIVLVEEVEVVL